MCHYSPDSQFIVMRNSFGFGQLNSGEFPMLMTHDVNLPSKKHKIEFVRFSGSNRLWHIHNHFGSNIESTPISVAYSDVPPDPFCNTCHRAWLRMLRTG